MVNDVYSDYIKALIYEDYLRALRRTRDGADPDAEHRAHEDRCAPLRRLIAQHERRFSAKQEVIVHDFRAGSAAAC